MLLNRLLVVMLICCVMVRENFPSLVTSVSGACHFQACLHPDEYAATHEDSLVPVSLDEDSEVFDDEIPGRDEFPPEDGEIPVVLESDLDLEVDEVVCPGVFNPRLGLVSPCLLHEYNPTSFASFNSFCILKKLRT